MASSGEELQNIDLQVKALAERIADKRETVESLERQGKRTGHLQAALAVLTDLFLRRVRYRDLVAEASAGDQPGASA
ncbi:MAG: hypothetical protein ACJ8AS_07505 [Hyphomicrobiales bacterium]